MAVVVIYYNVDSADDYDLLRVFNTDLDPLHNFSLSLSITGRNLRLLKHQSDEYVEFVAFTKVLLPESMYDLPTREK